MNKEDFFIKHISSSEYIGDDGALIGDIVYSSDSFFEDVHFKRLWMSLKQIAIKSMLINISDAIVMNSLPKYALLNIAIPNKFTKKDLKSLTSGFNKIAKKYNIDIIGGDTISNDKLHISITLISIILKNSKPILRKGAQKGDLVCYTGDLGSCKKDLNRLLNNKRISKKSKFIKPILKDNFFYEAAPYINCALDISDGLFSELERLSKINCIGFDFFDMISQKLGCSGEEYEILFTYNSKNRKKIEKIAKKYAVDLNTFAKCIKGSYKSICKSHHF